MSNALKVAKNFIALFAVIIVFGIVQEASAASLELTQEQKESYYKQYTAIIEEVNSQYNGDLELGPLEDFKSEEWVEPKDFKEIATDMVDLDFVVKSNPTNDGVLPRAAQTASKTVTTTIKNVSVNVTVSGSFNTHLVGDIQRFHTDINYIRSSANKGTWSQTGYTGTLIDASRTYSIDVGGKFTYNNISSTTNVTVKFHCSASGVVT